MLRMSQIVQESNAILKKTVKHAVSQRPSAALSTLCNALAVLYRILHRSCYAPQVSAKGKMMS